MKHFYVYVAVITGGAAVLAIEILGTRLLAPFYGADIYLWSALISVTLAALSVGYVVGGRYADRGPRATRLAVVIGVAGIWIAAIPWLRSPLFDLASTMDLRLGILVVALLLFFPPLALLGMISPYAIRLSASRLENVGTTAGNLYAVSTIASVVAALATGFVLIPNVGVQKLLVAIGLILIAVATIGFVTQKNAKGSVAALFVLALATFFSQTQEPSDAARPEAGLLAVVSSPYADVRVYEKDSVRYMLLDGGSHTAVDLTTGQSTMAYVNVMDLAKDFVNVDGRMLAIGLGGGSVVKNFARDGWTVAAVELDPVVIQMARVYFDLTDQDCRIYLMDGRQYLKENAELHDVVILDAYGSSFIPSHLASREAFELIKSRMSPEGVLAINVQCVGWNDPIVASVAATVGTSFRYTLALPIAEPPNQFGNLVIMASDRPLELKSEPPVPSDRFSPEYDRVHAWDNRFLPDVSGAVILTDDFNPIESWSARINFAARKSLHESVDIAGVAW